jgi:hypothetical protein
VLLFWQIATIHPTPVPHADDIYHLRFVTTFTARCVHPERY